MGAFATFFLLIGGGFAFPSAQGQIIPPVRRADWSNAGVEGGIPQVTRIYTNVSPGVSLTTLNNLIRACPSNQVVFMAAGQYTFAGPISFGQKAGVVLRGAGPTQTKIAFNAHNGSANVVIGEETIDRVNPPSSQVKNWTGGYAQGSTQLTLNSVTGLPSPGHLLNIDQLDDGVFVNSTTQEGCPYCGRGNGARTQGQRVRIVSVSGNTVTVDPGIYMPNYRSSQNPQVWYWTEPDTEMCGLEDLSITSNTGSGLFAIYISQAQNCWVKNVAINNSAQAAIETSLCKNIEVRHVTLGGLQSATSQSYGVVWYMCSDGLMIDSIAHDITGAMNFGPQASGCVVAYNYFTNLLYTPSSWNIAALASHDSHVCMNLVEGNYANTMYFDSIHGSASHNTVFRNRLTGWQPGRTGNTISFVSEQYCRSNNLVGNVLGTPGYHTHYACKTQSECNSFSDTSIMVLGNGNAACGNGATPLAWDSNVAASTLVHGNYDYVNKSQMWDSSISDRNVPASLFLASKPSFFGNLPWPPVDPANPSSASPTNIPAGYRYIYGTDPATGPINQPPIAAANATPRSGVSPLNVSFSSAGSSDPEGATLTYNWVFGDGATSTAANPSHTYTADGSYTANLTVSDGVNSTRSADISIKVGNQAPVVAASGSPLSGPSPLTVSFSSAGSSDPEGSALTYSWVFGDGGTSTAANPSHTYQSNGVYTAKLTVSDGVKTSTSSDLTVVVSDGLVGWYPFNEGTGSAVADQSGRANNAAVQGAAWTAGVGGNALGFTNAYVSVSVSSSLDLSTGMTLSAWVYPTTLGGWRDVIYRGNDTYFLEASSPANAGPVTGGTFASGPLVGPTPLPLNKWSHIASTFDGSTLRLFVDGVQVASRAETGPIANSPTQPLTIGGDPSSGTYFSGVIDEVRIYNRALNASEIVAVASRPAAPANLRVLP